MKLTDSERAMLDGRESKAQQKAMELLVRYAQALGADRFVITNNVAGVPGTYTPFLFNYYGTTHGATRENAYDLIYSLFDLDSDEVVEVPQVSVHSCHLQGGVDPVGQGGGQRRVVLAGTGGRCLCGEQRRRQRGLAVDDGGVGLDARGVVQRQAGGREQQHAQQGDGRTDPVPAIERLQPPRARGLRGGSGHLVRISLPSEVWRSR